MHVEMAYVYGIDVNLGMISLDQNQLAATRGCVLQFVGQH